MDNDELTKIIVNIVKLHISNYTLQLFKIKDGDFVAVGSSVLLDFRGTFWLLTAAHVSEVHTSGSELYFQYEENKFMTISGFLGESNLKLDNQIDYACLNLAAECVEKLLEFKSFLDPSNTAVVQRQFEKQTMIACGFPGDLTQNLGTRISSIGKYVITNTSNEKPYKYYKFDPDYFIIVDFSGKSTDPETGEKSESFQPHGMSGGGLWQVWKEDENFKFALVGILTEVRKSRYHVLISNRIEIVLDEIHRKLNELKKDPHNNG